MWKRWPSHRRRQERVISKPTLIETSLDEETLANIPSTFEAQQAHGTPTATPSNSQQAGFGRKGETPATSSMYSQRPHEMRRQDVRFFGVPDNLPITYEVSPPSSPDTGSQLQVDTSHTDGSVSPLEEVSDQGETFDEAVLVPPKFLFGGGMSNPDRDSVATRWGDFTRESTHADLTKSGLRRIDTSGTDSTLMKSRLGNQIQVTSGGEGDDPGIDEITPRCSPRGSAINNSLALDRLNSSEKQWMARSTEGKPLPATEPTTLPRKSSKRVSYVNIQIPDGSSPVYEPQSTFSKEEDIKPLVPLKAGRNSPSQRTSSLALPPTNGSTQRFLFHNDSKSIASSGTSHIRNPSKLSHGSGSWETLESSSSPRRATSAIESNLNVALNGMNLQDQPVSRFSATTYETETVTTLDTPPRSLYSSTVSVPSTPSPSLPPTPFNRHLALLGMAQFNTKATARKPLSYTMEPTPPPSASRPRTTKGLPPSPAEAQSVDLISSLQAQLDNLRHQRGNLQRIIQDLRRLLGPGPTALDRHARADLKKTVDECSADLDEIVRQEHDVGMRLHRAWRRQERDEHLDEPTGLWVRRVTG
ncbi:MAG: hypothetical protein M1816_001516 [Peltula sp. TS41687]|nr:MAG: hypothetical protein M1816_001516 [Peltula sp. TS41687]